ncbi:MAG: heme A synthase, partial [Rhodobacteraceae bacterium]
MNYVRLWLYILFALVFLMVIVGGLTRLTDSGLSITEWKPLTGALPPISVEGWLIEFQKYSEIPEFKLQNSDMSLSEFKVIYWWEWGHRQLGRIIGLVWFVGFFLLLGLRKFNKDLIWPSFLIGFLIGVQGAIGWWMVSSGLQDGMLDVASYRLSIHLLTAFFILSLIYWRILR